MQISHICPLFWQPLYIGNEGLDTIVFRFDSSTNHIFWERGPGILLYKEQITLAMDGYSIGSAEETEDDDGFIVFGLRYDGIRYHGCAKRTKPSFSSGKYKNLGYLYIEDENDLFFDAMNKLKDRECGEFVFVPPTHIAEEEIAFLILEHCYKHYNRHGNQESYQYKLLLLEVCHDKNAEDCNQILNEIQYLYKDDKIEKYFKPLIERKKRKFLHHDTMIDIKLAMEGNQRSHTKQKKGKEAAMIERKVNEYMNAWIKRKRIKYKQYLKIVRDLGKLHDFDRDIKMIKRKGSHSVLHFKGNKGAIPLVPRPHGRHKTSISIYIVKKWMQNFILSTRSKKWQLCAHLLTSLLFNCACIWDCRNVICCVSF